MSFCDDIGDFAFDHVEAQSREYQAQLRRQGKSRYFSVRGPHRVPGPFEEKSLFNKSLKERNEIRSNLMSKQGLRLTSRFSNSISDSSSHDLVG